MYKVETVLPDAGAKTSKSEQIEKMFDRIAPRYDAMNHLMTFQLDKLWRRWCINALADIKPKTVLDVATGTGDLSFETFRRLNPDTIIGIDISEQMLAVGREKAAKLGLQDKIAFERQNVASMTFPDCTFDAVISAFGVRNFEDLDGSLREMHRVLRTGGKLVMLELATPERFPFRTLYNLYSRLIPFAGKVFAKNEAAYSYLPDSISAVPQNDEMTAIMTKNGFDCAEYKTFTFGVCTMYSGKHP